MTEAQWLTSDDPQAMLRHLTHEQGKHASGGYSIPRGRLLISDRKLRLFACACLRAQHRDVIPRGLSSVDVTERAADGRKPTEEEKRKHGDWTHTAEGLQHMLHFIVGHPAADRTLQAALLREVAGNVFRPVKLDTSLGRVRQPETTWFDHRLITPAVLDLARAAYEHRLADGTLDPHRLLVLADALEEAGCHSEAFACGYCGGSGVHPAFEFNPPLPLPVTCKERCKACHGEGKVRKPHPVVAHLRSPGVHARGCWCVDLILGKE